MINCEGSKKKKKNGENSPMYLTAFDLRRVAQFCSLFKKEKKKKKTPPSALLPSVGVCVRAQERGVCVLVSL